LIPTSSRSVPAGIRKRELIAFCSGENVHNCIDRTNHGEQTKNTNPSEFILSVE